ncbi:hypothetical protein [Clostridium sp. LIBA-8841]|uniref:hypothetical protein n=1 Tax=Clostridium sp. LIBA-8841 TaxID=2987530 RepID=UPI002AC7231D|nr:hypothetical protein [Clostridium sp. LIBA-8841]MDZ5253985.1 hypothetical protein [Clostridium sp. LIBA-8841]
MKKYERKLKIEIITIFVMIDYLLMYRRASSNLESFILLGIALSWILFALGYHIWDIKSRKLTLKGWFHSFIERFKKIEGNKIYLKLWKYSTILQVILGVLLVLITVGAYVIMKAPIVEYILTLGVLTTVLLGIAESFAFVMAGILRASENKNE